MALTPADKGILQVALEDAQGQGLGDDAICDELAAALMLNSSCLTEAMAWEMAYDFCNG